MSYSTKHKSVSLTRQTLNEVRGISAIRGEGRESNSPPTRSHSNFLELVVKVTQNVTKIGDLKRRVEITNVKCAQTLRLYYKFDAIDHTKHKELQL